VIRTRAEPLGWEVIVGDPFTELEPEKCSARSSSIPAHTAMCMISPT
jgi:glycine dehydrogenase